MKKKINKFLFENTYVLDINIIIRIISLFGIIKTLLILPDLKFLGELGLIESSINSLYTFSYQPTFSLFYRFFNYLGVSENIVSLFFEILLLISLLFVFSNYKRVSFAILSWLIHGIFVNSTFLFSYGADYFTTFILFLNILFCVASKLDFLNKKNITSFLIRFLQIHLCIVYFFAGLGKSLGTSWFDGNAIWYVINRFSSQLLTENILIFTKLPLFFKIIGWVTLIIELFYPALIFCEKTRKTTLYLVLFMHLLIGIVMNLYVFGTIMILINIIAFGSYLKEDVLRITSFKIRIRKINVYNIFNI